MKCTKCQYHQVINDRDPHDWFCDDDAAIVCTKLKNTHRIMNSIYPSDRSEFRIIGCAMRPYDVDKVKSPSWCPLQKRNRK